MRGMAAFVAAFAAFACLTSPAHAQQQQAATGDAGRAACVERAGTSSISQRTA